MHSHLTSSIASPAQSRYSHREWITAYSVAQHRSNSRSASTRSTSSLRRTESAQRELDQLYGFDDVISVPSYKIDNRQDLHHRFVTTTSTLEPAAARAYLAGIASTTPSKHSGAIVTTLGSVQDIDRSLVYSRENSTAFVVLEVVIFSPCLC